MADKMEETKMHLKHPHPLSHQAFSYERAIKIAHKTKPGDTILMNFYVDQDAYATVMFMKNENGKMKIRQIHGPYDSIDSNWTYSVTDFPWR